MLEIIILGRGGQGAQTAGNLLARAFFAEGKYVQTFSTYGGARRGGPVSSFIRVDDQPIRHRCSIDNPDAILCFDPSLLDTATLRMVRPETLILVNADPAAAALDALKAYNIIPINGVEVSQANGLGHIINSALVGAFVAVLEQPSLETLQQVVEASAPVKKPENVAAYLDGYHRVRKILSKEYA